MKMLSKYHFLNKDIGNIILEDNGSYSTEKKVLLLNDKDTSISGEL